MSFQPPRILLIDDDDSALIVLRKLLEAETCEVDVSSSSEEGLQRLTQESYDAIFCDMWMDGMTGKDLYLELKDRLPEYQRKIVFVTGDLASEETWEFIDERQLPYLLKPFSRPELRRRLREILGEARFEPPEALAVPADHWDGKGRRRNRRFAFKANVRVRRKKFSVEPPEVCAVLNASRDGVLFETAVPYRVGTEVVVAFPYTGHNDLEQDGFVVRSETLSNGRYSVALALGEAAEIFRTSFVGSEEDARRHSLVSAKDKTPGTLAAQAVESQKLAAVQAEARRLKEQMASLKAAHDHVLDQRDRLAKRESELNEELGDLSSSKQELTLTVDGLQGQMEKLQKELDSTEAVRYQATHDGLTGLLNRGAILDILRRELARAQREGTSVGVLIGDLDHFKRINDTYGHLVGDAVLCEAARRISAAVRTDDAVGRYGGEEFLIVLPGCDDETEAQAERIRQCVAALPVGTTDGTVAVTITLGGVLSSSTGNIEAMLRAADIALYRAKRAGRNRFELAGAADLAGAGLPAK